MDRPAAPKPPTDEVWSWPPLFTLQPVAATRERQLARWSDLLVAWCADNQLVELNVEQTQSLPWRNSTIDRTLSTEGARAVVEFMRQRGRADWVDVSTTSTPSRALVFVSRRPDDWAELLWKWASESGQLNSVFTLFELRAGDAARGELWEGLDEVDSSVARPAPPPTTTTTAPNLLPLPNPFLSIADPAACGTGS